MLLCVLLDMALLNAEAKTDLQNKQINMLLKTGGGTVENGKNKKIKVVIIVLSVLLCVSIVALASIFIYNYFFSYKSTSVVISVNIIT